MENERKSLDYEIMTALNFLLLLLSTAAAATVNISLTVDILHFNQPSVPISFVTRAYNHQFSGPTIRVRAGDTLHISLANHLGPDNDGPNNWFRLPNTTNLHLHGLHISPSGQADDIFRTTSPGDTSVWIYDIPSDHSPGTYFYHPHVHGSSSNQQGGGMAGALIVDPPENSPPLPAAIAAMEEEVLLLQHLCFHNEGKYQSSTPYINHLNVVKYGLDNVDPQFMNHQPSALPDYYLVNGLYRPTIHMLPGQFKRFRLIAAGLNAFLALHVAQCETYVLAKDGIWVGATAYLEEWHLLVPGSRIDLGLRCNNTGIYNVASSKNAPPYHEDIATTTVVFDGILVQLNVSGSPVSMQIPTVLPPRASYLVDLSNVTTPVPAGNLFDLTFLTKGGPFAPGLPFPVMQINDESFQDKNHFVHNMTLDEIQEWTVGIEGDSNVGAGNHPFHVHVNSFQIVAIDGETTRKATMGVRVGEYRDTIPLMMSGKYTIRFVPKRYIGRVLIHCHMIPHVDLGMAAVGQIVAGEHGEHGEHVEDNSL